MNTALKGLALTTLILSFFAYANTFGGIDMRSTVASAIASINSLLPSDTQQQTDAETEEPIPQIVRVSEDDKLKLLKRASGMVASTTEDEAKQDEEDEGDEQDEEDKISIEGWRIFYTEPNFGGTQAYTLRYPNSWVMNDDNPRTKILMYDVDGRVFSFSFSEVPMSYTQFGTPEEEEVVINEVEYTKHSWLQHGTTTLITYTPKQSTHKPFKVALGTLPPLFSSEYVDLYERILSTLAVEPADYPFTISDLEVKLTGPVLTTTTAIAEPLELSWKISENKKISQDKTELNIWIEDDNNSTVDGLDIKARYNARSAIFTIPETANDNLSFSKRYRAVAQGTSNGQQTNKAYSNWFTVPNPVQFTNARLVATPIDDISPVKVSIDASITDKSGQDYAYIVFLDDGAYSVLRDEGDQKFRGEWRRTYTDTSKEHTIYLMRTTADALKQNLYGAQTYRDVQQYATTIVSTTFSIE